MYNNDPNQAQQPPPYGQPDWSQQPPAEYVQPPSPYQQTQWAQPPTPPPYEPAQYGQPQYYGAPPAPGYAQPQPRQSNRWVWITLGVLGGLIVLGLIACVLFFVLIGRAAQQTVNTVTTSIEQTETAVSSPAAAQATVEQYYTAIQSQDYTTAYSYLESNMTTTSGQTLTRQLFTQAATGRDTSLGTVTNFTITQNASDATKFTISVTRGSSALYTVNIQVTQVGSDWKISSYDEI